MTQNINSLQIPSHEMSESERRNFAEKLQGKTYPQQLKILYSYDFIIPDGNTTHKPIIWIHRKNTREQFLLEKGAGIFPVAENLFFENFVLIDEIQELKEGKYMFFQFQIQNIFYLFRLSYERVIQRDWRGLEQIKSSQSEGSFKTKKDISDMVRFILEPSPSNSLC